MEPKQEGTNPIRWPEYSDCQFEDCADCGLVILGSMFTCNLCDNHHICASCYNDTIVEESIHSKKSQNLPAEHPHMHHSYRLDMSPFGKLAFPVHDNPCASCGSKVFPGLRYVCPEICPDYGICATCFIKKKGTDEIELFEAVQANPKLEKKYQIGAAIVTQKYYGIGLARLDWFQICKDDEDQMKNLGRKIGFAVYQYPTNLPQEERNSLNPDQLEELMKNIEQEANREANNNNTKTKKKFDSKFIPEFGYTKEQEEHIIKLRDELFDINRRQKKYKEGESNIVETKFVFVSFFADGSHSNILPLICLRISDTRTMYVESTGRAYDDWDDFLSKNKLPECNILYPYDGLYEMEPGGILNLRYDISRRSKLPSKIAKISDRSAMGIGIAATIGSVIGLFTPLAPVAATTLLYTAIGTGVYTMARSGYHIVDRATHNENVNPLRSRENFVDWLAVAASLASFGAIGGSAYLTVMATQGIEVSQAIEYTVNAAIFANFAVSGIALTASGYNIFEKVANGERPTPLELFQFSTSLLFFTNAAVNLQTAERLIQQTTQEKINDYRDGLKTAEDKQQFDNTINENMKKTEGQSGNSKIKANLETIKDIHKAMLADKHVEAHIHEHELPKKSKPMPSSSVPKMQAKQLSVSDKKIVEEHLQALDAKGLAKLPASKQKITTYLNVGWDDIAAKVKAVLSGGAGGAITEKLIEGKSKKVVTIDNGDEGFMGAKVESIPNGVSIRKGVIDRIEITLNDAGEPIPHFVEGTIRSGTEQSVVRIRLENRGALGNIRAKPKVRMYKENSSKGVEIDDQELSENYFMCYDWS
ncbi:hypothetical protein GCK72_025474 [Caenorhabditis remanei]|uniref:ZZ-type domain-containing protein n=1 Tax=Caenorhabditis remanei TaxID=31234 RepID=A0A6A5G225_CAERE|nr:hypothetical protein GCK72_025474 [Caenorhabditis remanei]KAF1749007.1 hypothetical protein GCK72_025474 [Caenorhabditis remanei]